MIEELYAEAHPAVLPQDVESTVPAVWIDRWLVLSRIRSSKDKTSQPGQVEQRGPGVRVTTVI